MQVGACVQGRAAGPALLFASGYRKEGRNFVELGVVTRCGETSTVYISRYDASKNLPRIETGYQHEMRAPHRSPSCTDHYITAVATDQSVQANGTSTATSNSLKIEIPSLQYGWIADPKAPSAYTLSTLVDSNAAAIDQVVGFAFQTEAPLQGPVTPRQITYRFKGDMFHKNSDAGPRDPWQVLQSPLDLTAFTSQKGGAILAQTRIGSANVIAQRGQEIWWQNSLLLDRDQSALSPLLQVSGHDFNNNGCFDELGHNRMLLPIPDNEKNVRAMVYIEYSPEPNDGIPMLSVGRYYR
jgi:hypothetical protein